MFVDDPAFIMDGRALVTQMKPPTRAGEIGPMRETFHTARNKRDPSNGLSWSLFGCWGYNVHW